MLRSGAGGMALGRCSTAASAQGRLLLPAMGAHRWQMSSAQGSARPMAGLSSMSHIATTFASSPASFKSTRQHFTISAPAWQSAHSHAQLCVQSNASWSSLQSQRARNILHSQSFTSQVACCSSSVSDAATAAGEPVSSTSAAGPSLRDQYNTALSIAQLTPQQVQQLETYLDLLLETNKVMNLTAVRDPEEARVRHIADSLALLPVLDKHIQQMQAQPPGGRGTPVLQPRSSSSVPGTRTAGQTSTGSKEAARGGNRAGSGADGSTITGSSASATSTTSSAPLRMIDVGTGPGLPGMVLAIARPHWQVTLLDSLRKRCDFMTKAAQVAGVNNVSIVWSRAEDAGRKPELRDGFDVALARAVAETRVLAELCLPFVRPQGLWVAAKGPDPQAEVAAAEGALNKLGGTLLGVDLVQSYSSEGQRTAVVVRKNGVTPQKYPRAPGTPNKSPL